MEHLRVNFILLLLVLDRWICELPRRIHISDVWRLFSDLLHDHCIGRGFDESYCRDRWPHVFFPLFFRSYIVSHSLGNASMVTLIRMYAAMASCSLSDNWVGGGGCIVFRRIHT